MKSCFFIGHREALSELLPTLTQIVEKHIAEYGVTECIVGGYGGFDHLASKAVSNARDLVEYAYNRERKRNIRITLIGRDGAK